MAGDHRSTTKHNIDILAAAGFIKQGNSSIFKKGDICLLSPGVACGQGGHYWFDIRQVNLKQISSSINPAILIRIVPDLFVFIKLSDFKTMLSEATRRVRKNSGDVWGFYMALENEKKVAKIVSSANSSLYIKTPIFDIRQIRHELINYS